MSIVLINDLECKWMRTSARTQPHHEWSTWASFVWISGHGSMMLMTTIMMTTTTTTTTMMTTTMMLMMMMMTTTMTMMMTTTTMMPMMTLFIIVVVIVVVIIVIIVIIHSTFIPSTDTLHPRVPSTCFLRVASCNSINPIDICSCGSRFFPRLRRPRSDCTGGCPPLFGTGSDAGMVGLGNSNKNYSLFAVWSPLLSECWLRCVVIP